MISCRQFCGKSCMKIKNFQHPPSQYFSRLFYLFLQFFTRLFSLPVKPWENNVFLVVYKTSMGCFLVNFSFMHFSQRRAYPFLILSFFSFNNNNNNNNKNHIYYYHNCICSSIVRALELKKMSSCSLSTKLVVLLILLI